MKVKCKKCGFSFEMEDEMEDLEKLINKFSDLEELPEQVHEIIENLNKITKD